MEEKFDLLFGRFPNKGAANASLHKKMWMELSATLNSMGPVKSVSNWRKCFLDMKSKVKEKVTKRRGLSRVGGDGPAGIELYSSMDDKIISMFNITRGGNPKVMQLRLKNIRPKLTLQETPLAVADSPLIPVTYPQTQPHAPSSPHPPSSPHAASSHASSPPRSASPLNTTTPDPENQQQQPVSNICEQPIQLQKCGIEILKEIKNQQERHNNATLEQNNKIIKQNDKIIQLLTNLANK